MRRTNRIVSTIVLFCFVLNTAVLDLAFGQNLNFNSDNLAVPSELDDLVGIQHKDMGRIQLALEAMLVKVFNTGIPVNMGTFTNILKNQSIKENTIFQPADIQFLFNEIKLTKDGPCVMSRVKDKDGLRTYYALFSMQKDKEGGFPIRVITENEYKKAAESVKQLPQRKDKKPEDAAAIKRYIQHEKGIDTVIRYAHEHGLAKEPLMDRLDYRKTVLDLFKILNIRVRNPNQLIPIEDRKLFLIRMTNEIRSMVEKLPQAKVVDENGTEHTIFYEEHSGNNRIHIFVDDRVFGKCFDLVTEAGPITIGKNELILMDEFKEDLRFDIAYAIGVMLNQPLTKTVFLKPDSLLIADRFEERQLWNEVAERYFQFYQTKKQDFSPLDAAIVDLNTNLKTRDYASGTERVAGNSASQIGDKAPSIWLMKKYEAIVNKFFDSYADSLKAGDSTKPGSFTIAYMIIDAYLKEQQRKLRPEDLQPLKDKFVEVIAKISAETSIRLSRDGVNKILNEFCFRRENVKDSIVEGMFEMLDKAVIGEDLRAVELVISMPSHKSVFTNYKEYCDRVIRNLMPSPPITDEQNKRIVKSITIAKTIYDAYLDEEGGVLTEEKKKYYGDNMLWDLKDIYTTFGDYRFGIIKNAHHILDVIYLSSTLHRDTSILPTLLHMLYDSTWKKENSAELLLRLDYDTLKSKIDKKRENIDRVAIEAISKEDAISDKDLKLVLDTGFYYTFKLRLKAILDELEIKNNLFHPLGMSKREEARLFSLLRAAYMLRKAKIELPKDWVSADAVTVGLNKLSSEELGAAVQLEKNIQTKIENRYGKLKEAPYFFKSKLRKVISLVFGAAEEFDKRMWVTPCYTAILSSASYYALIYFNPEGMKVTIVTKDEFEVMKALKPFVKIAGVERASVTQELRAAIANVRRGAAPAQPIAAELQKFHGSEKMQDVQTTAKPDSGTITAKIPDWVRTEIMAQISDYLKGYKASPEDVEIEQIQKDVFRVWLIVRLPNIGKSTIIINTFDLKDGKLIPRNDGGGGIMKKDSIVPPSRYFTDSFGSALITLSEASQKIQDRVAAMPPESDIRSEFNTLIQKKDDLINRLKARIVAILQKECPADKTPIEGDVIVANAKQGEENIFICTASVLPQGSNELAINGFHYKLDSILKSPKSLIENRTFGELDTFLNAQDDKVLRALYAEIHELTRSFNDLGALEKSAAKDISVVPNEVRTEIMAQIKDFLEQYKASPKDVIIEQISENVFRAFLKERQPDGRELDMLINTFDFKDEKLIPRNDGGGGILRNEGRRDRVAKSEIRSRIINAVEILNNPQLAYTYHHDLQVALSCFPKLAGRVGNLEGLPVGKIARETERLQQALGCENVFELAELFQSKQVIKAAKKQLRSLDRDLKRENKKAPGKSPEDALIVIALSKRLRGLLETQGWFTVNDYLAGYAKMSLKFPDTFEPLAEKDPESTVRNDLYRNERSLVKQGVLGLVPSTQKSGAYKFALTKKGEVEVDSIRKEVDSIRKEIVVKFESSKNTSADNSAVLNWVQHDIAEQLAIPVNMLNITQIDDQGEVFEVVSRVGSKAISEGIFQVDYSLKEVTRIPYTAGGGILRDERDYAATGVVLKGHEFVRKICNSITPSIDVSLSTLEYLLRRGKKEDLELFVEKIRAAQKAGATSFHVDIFSPNFVETDKATPEGNMSVYNPDIFKILSEAGITMPGHAHLMVGILKPGEEWKGPSGYAIRSVGEFKNYIKRFTDNGAKLVTVHYGAFKNRKDGEKELVEVLEFIRKQGALAGLAINPDEDAVKLWDYKRHFDFPLIMTVVPGAGGRGFDERGMENLIKVKEIIGNDDMILAADGAINPDNIGKLVSLGLNFPTVGSAYFGNKKNGLFSAPEISAAHDRLINKAELEGMPYLGGGNTNLSQDIKYNVLLDLIASNISRDNLLLLINAFGDPLVYESAYSMSIWPPNYEKVKYLANRLDKIILDVIGKKYNLTTFSESAADRILPLLRAALALKDSVMSWPPIYTHHAMSIDNKGVATIKGLPAYEIMPVALLGEDLRRAIEEKLGKDIKAPDSSWLPYVSSRLFVRKLKNIPDQVQSYAVSGLSYKKANTLLFGEARHFGKAKDTYIIACASNLYSKTTANSEKYYGIVSFESGKMNIVVVTEREMSSLKYLENYVRTFERYWPDRDAISQYMRADGKGKDIIVGQPTVHATAKLNPSYLENWFRDLEKFFAAQYDDSRPGNIDVVPGRICAKNNRYVEMVLKKENGKTHIEYTARENTEHDLGSKVTLKIYEDKIEYTTKYEDRAMASGYGYSSGTYKGSMSQIAFGVSVNNRIYSVLPLNLFNILHIQGILPIIPAHDAESYIVSFAPTVKQTSDAIPSWVRPVVIDWLQKNEKRPGIDFDSIVVDLVPGDRPNIIEASSPTSALQTNWRFVFDSGATTVTPLVGEYGGGVFKNNESRDKAASEGQEKKEFNPERIAELIAASAMSRSDFERKNVRKMIISGGYLPEALQVVKAIKETLMHRNKQDEIAGKLSPNEKRVFELVMKKMKKVHHGSVEARHLDITLHFISNAAQHTVSIPVTPVTVVTASNAKGIGKSTENRSMDGIVPGWVRNGIVRHLDNINDIKIIPRGKDLYEVFPTSGVVRTSLGIFEADNAMRRVGLIIGTGGGGIIVRDASTKLVRLIKAAVERASVTKWDGTPLTADSTPDAKDGIPDVAQVASIQILKEIDVLLNSISDVAVLREVETGLENYMKSARPQQYFEKKSQARQYKEWMFLLHQRMLALLNSSLGPIPGMKTEIHEATLVWIGDNGVRVALNPIQYKIELKAKKIDASFEFLQSPAQLSMQLLWPDNLGGKKLQRREFKGIGLNAMYYNEPLRQLIILITPEATNAFSDLAYIRLGSSSLGTIQIMPQSEINRLPEGSNRLPLDEMLKAIREQKLSTMKSAATNEGAIETEVADTMAYVEANTRNLTSILPKDVKVETVRNILVELKMGKIGKPTADKQLAGLGLKEDTIANIHQPFELGSVPAGFNNDGGISRKDANAPQGRGAELVEKIWDVLKEHGAIRQGNEIVFKDQGKAATLTLSLTDKNSLLISRKSPPPGAFRHELQIDNEGVTIRLVAHLHSAEKFFYTGPIEPVFDKKEGLVLIVSDEFDEIRQVKREIEKSPSKTEYYSAARQMSPIPIYLKSSAEGKKAGGTPLLRNNGGGILRDDSTKLVRLIKAAVERSSVTKWDGTPLTADSAPDAKDGTPDAAQVASIQILKEIDRLLKEIEDAKGVEALEEVISGIEALKKLAPPKQYFEKKSVERYQEYISRASAIMERLSSGRSIAVNPRQSSSSAATDETALQEQLRDIALRTVRPANGILTEGVLRAHLGSVIAKMVPPTGGILAADESTGSAGKRLDSVGLPNTPENRQAMRELMLTVPGQKEAGISAVILFDETFDNVDRQGRNLIRHHLLDRGILPGIKTDRGLIPVPDSPGEMIPDPRGLMQLPALLETYSAKGAVFTKWRVTVAIDPAKHLPTDANIRKNMEVLALSAKMTQEAGLVPIVEPEVLLDGAHDINVSYKTTTRTLEILFEELVKAGVWLDRVVLKTSMILSGNKAANRADSQTVGYETLKGLLKAVPVEVPAIVFLSGGQGDDEVNENLNGVSLARLNRLEAARDEAAFELEAEGKKEAATKLRQLIQSPWEISYSFGRGLQRPGLKVWQGKDANFAAAQEALRQATLITQKARLGQLHGARMATVQNGLVSSMIAEELSTAGVVPDWVKDAVRQKLPLQYRDKALEFVFFISQSKIKVSTSGSLRMELAIFNVKYKDDKNLQSGGTIDLDMWLGGGMMRDETGKGVARSQAEAESTAEIPHKIYVPPYMIDANIIKQLIDTVAPLAPEAGKKIAEESEGPPQFLLPIEFFKNKDEFDEQKSKFGDRFRLESVSGITASPEQYISNLLGKVGEGEGIRSVALVPMDTDIKLLEQLTAKGIRFIPVNMNILDLKGFDTAARNKFQINTFGMMCAVRGVKTLDKESPVYKILSVYIMVRLELPKDISVDDYIEAIVKNDVAKIKKAYLKPVQPYDIEEHNLTISTPLIFA